MTAKQMSQLNTRIDIAYQALVLNVPREALARKFRYSSKQAINAILAHAKKNVIIMAAVEARITAEKQKEQRSFT